MQLGTRRMLDRAFAGSGVMAIVLMGASLILLLAPVFVKGIGAVFFRGTVEHRRMVLEKFGRGDRASVGTEIAESSAARAPVYAAMKAFESELENAPAAERRVLSRNYREFKSALKELLGPIPGELRPMLMRDQYGQTRWDRARVKLQKTLYREEWDYSNPAAGGVRMLKPRALDFAGTALAPVFPLIERDAERPLLPRRTVYWRFLTDDSFDSHFFGGIRAEMTGTFYLAVGAMIFALPMALGAAVYLTEYTRGGWFVGFLRTCISTLAGVPSIVFGLFGLAFFINTVKVSDSKSVLAGSLTLALLILPTMIRAAEEAIRAVPSTYREAALSLGAGRWHTVWSVVLPAAMPGILTGTVISMGRAAGETAPIIFTAAVSVGRPLSILQTFNSASPALSWNIYNLATEHAAVDEIRHVQFGMVFVLVSLVLILNLAAMILRARIAGKMRA